MLTRREWGATAAAFLGSCAIAPDAPSEPAPIAGALYFDMHIDTPSRMVSELAYR